MWMLDKLDKLLPGKRTTDNNIRKQYVDDYINRLQEGLISKEQARRGLGIIDDPYMDPNICGEPYEEWATKSEHQWRERAKAMKDKCLWCTTPYEDDSGSCTKCGAPKDVDEVHAGQPRFSNVTWRI